MHASRWSSEFGLYKYDDLKKESTATKFIVLVTIVGIVLFSVFYLCIILLKDNAEKNPPRLANDTLLETEVFENSTLSAEKLVSPITDRFSMNIKQSPSPFINNIRGPIPASFVANPTEKSSATYPQLQNYARPGYPRNIQDIINYIAPEKSHQDSKKVDRLKNNPVAFPGNRHDPFYTFKPKDPSDINLLATSNLRFAPPVWKDMRVNPLGAQSVQRPMEVGRPAKRSHRSLTLSLNVFPMVGDANRQNFYAFTANGNHPMAGRRKPRKMIIHLNVFGGDDGPERDDDDFDNPSDLEVFKELFATQEDHTDDDRD